jgi:hypothetical protein
MVRYPAISSAAPCVSGQPLAVALPVRSAPTPERIRAARGGLDDGEFFRVARVTLKPITAPPFVGGAIASGWRRAASFEFLLAAHQPIALCRV